MHFFFFFGCVGMLCGPESKLKLIYQLHKINVYKKFLVFGIDALLITQKRHEILNVLKPML